MTFYSHRDRNARIRRDCNNMFCHATLASGGHRYPNRPELDALDHMLDVLLPTAVAAPLSARIQRAVRAAWIREERRTWAQPRATRKNVSEVSQ